MSLNWQPQASLANLRMRAKMLADIRAFFAARDVLEVQTPLLCQYSVTDPAQSAMTSECWFGDKRKTGFLQTSPEYAMKRLLAAGSGSIYQICKAFRDEACGHQHQAEFTMLEWYRTGFDDHALMDEVDALLQAILDAPAAVKFSYQEVFKRYCDLNPHATNAEALTTCLQVHSIAHEHLANASLDTHLECVMSQVIEPQLAALNTPVMIYDYPTSQSALAKRRIVDDTEVAARFEVFYRGFELGNGYDELTDAREQQARFDADNAMRQSQGLPQRDPDPFLLAAMQSGLPPCAGIAMGVDRLCLIKTGERDIASVVSFAGDRA